MNIAIVGPGAMGCLFAGLLARGGHHVTLIDHRPGRAARVRRQGVVIEGPQGTLLAPVGATAGGRLAARPELILVCVKSYDTAAAAGRVAPLAGPDTLVLTLQNGLGNAEELLRAFGPERVLAGVTGQGATYLGPGRVRHAGFGKTYLGWASPEAEGSEPGRERLAAVGESFRAAGLECECVPRVRNYIWHKLIMNAAINPLGALLRLRNGDLLASQPAMSIAAELVRETVATARLSGALLPAENYLAEVEALLGQTRDNLCSMLQDVLRGKRTEVAYINGAVGRAAEDMGMVTSVNLLVAQLVEALEQSYERRVSRP